MPVVLEHYSAMPTTPEIPLSCPPQGSDSERPGVAEPCSARTRFKLGAALLLANVPFGYGGVIAASALAVMMKRPSWLLVGGVAYALSWLMLGTGLLLTGPEGIKYIRGFRGRQIRRHR